MNSLLHQSPSRMLQHLARLHGIQTQYEDVEGRQHEATDRSLKLILETMGVRVADEVGLKESLDRRIHKHWSRPFPPVLVKEQGEDLIVPVQFESSATFVPPSSIDANLTLEQGQNHQGRLAVIPEAIRRIRQVSGGFQFVRLLYRLTFASKIPLGYHRLVLEREGKTHQLSLIVSPSQANTLEDGVRVWGLTQPLYSLRSTQSSSSSSGIGTLGDLDYLIDLAAQEGASLVGTTPLHDLFAKDPESASPYSPSSRLFKNPLYLDLSRISSSHAIAPDIDPNVAADKGFRSTTSSSAIAYKEVSRLKHKQLKKLYAEFCDSRSEKRQKDFERFCQVHGAALERHALHSALCEELASEFGIDWRNWPPPYRDPQSPQTLQFALDHQALVDYYKWLQWQVDCQLSEAKRKTHEKKLRLGLYLDLAVGSSPCGSDVWSHQDLYAQKARVGAPPDSFNQLGQDWGLPPWIPEALRDSAYSPFIEMIRANTKDAGVLRIDHVMGLARLYWIPGGASPSEGAYVRYPLHDLAKIVALESHRAQCLIIGEDLGTVPKQVKSAMERYGLYSYRLLLFEKNDSGAFLSPKDFPRSAAIAATTHDLPTLGGFLHGTDIDERERLRLFPTPQHGHDARTERKEDLHQLFLALERHSVLPESLLGSGQMISGRMITGQGPDPHSPLHHGRDTVDAWVFAIYSYLAEAPSPILLVNLDDLAGTRVQTNLPGTSDERPNWRHRLPLTLEELTKSESFRRLLAELRKRRGS